MSYIGKDQLSQLLRHYKLTKVIESKQLKDGFANDSYLVVTDKSEKYVIKILRTQSPTGIASEVAIQKALEGSGIVTPTYLTLQNGKAVGEEAGFHFVISTFIEGQTPAKVTLKLAYSFGQTLARLHDALDPAKVHIEPNDTQWLDPHNARQEIERCTLEIKKRLGDILDRTKSLFELGLPKAIIHADLRMINTFALYDEVTAVFDFETAEYNLRLLDVAQSYLALLYYRTEDAQDLLKAVCNGYDSVAKQPLWDEEKVQLRAAIHYTAAACTAWDFNNGESEYAEKLLRLAGVGRG